MKEPEIANENLLFSKCFQGLSSIFSRHKSSVFKFSSSFSLIFGAELNYIENLTR